MNTAFAANGIPSRSVIQPCNLGSRVVQPPRGCSGWAKQRVGIPPVDDNNLCNWLLAFIKLHHALGLWICWIWCNHTDWQTSHKAVVNTQEEPRKTTNCNHRHQLPTHIQQLVWHPSWRQLPVTMEQVDNTSSNHSEDPSNNNGSISSSSNFTMASSTKDESCFITNKTLKDRMEAIKPTIVTPKSDPMQTDVALFQEAMGKAVKALQVTFQNCGFCHLVDTNKRLRKDFQRNHRQTLSQTRCQTYPLLKTVQGEWMRQPSNSTIQTWNNTRKLSTWAPLDFNCSMRPSHTDWHSKKDPWDCLQTSTWRMPWLMSSSEVGQRILWVHVRFIELQSSTWIQDKRHWWVLQIIPTHQTKTRFGCSSSRHWFESHCPHQSHSESDVHWRRWKERPSAWAQSQMGCKAK